MKNDLSTICKPIQTEVYLYITCIRIGKNIIIEIMLRVTHSKHECLFTPERKRERERERERGSGMANPFSPFP